MSNDTRYGWEYRHEDHTAAPGLIPKLNQLGRDGWEVVSVFEARDQEVHAILKRPIEVRAALSEETT